MEHMRRMSNYERSKLRQHPKEVVAKALALWLEGYTVKEMAESLGLSSYAVSGMVGGNHFPKERANGKNRHSLHVTTDRDPVNGQKPLPREKQLPRQPPVFQAVERPVEYRPSVFLSRTEGCRFPTWGNERPPAWTYCDDPRLDGSSYCACHHAIAYTGKATWGIPRGALG